ICARNMYEGDEFEVEQIPDLAVEVGLGLDDVVVGAVPGDGDLLMLKAAAGRSARGRGGTVGIRRAAAAGTAAGGKAKGQGRHTGQGEELLARNLFHKSDLQNLYLYRVFYAFFDSAVAAGQALGPGLADADQHDEDHTADGLQNGAGHADHQKAVVQNSDQDRAHHRRVSVGTAAAEAGHTAQDDGQHAVHVQAGAGVGSDGAVADDGHDGAKA